MSEQALLLAADVVARGADFVGVLALIQEVLCVRG